MERATITLETERAKWPNPGCLWWWWWIQDFLYVPKDRENNLWPCGISTTDVFCQQSRVTWTKNWYEMPV
jgi:hypothetical protein